MWLPAECSSLGIKYRCFVYSCCFFVLFFNVELAIPLTVNHKDNCEMFPHSEIQLQKSHLGCQNRFFIIELGIRDRKKRRRTGLQTEKRFLIFRHHLFLSLGEMQKSNFVISTSVHNSLPEKQKFIP